MLDRVSKEPANVAGFLVKKPELKLREQLRPGRERLDGRMSDEQVFGHFQWGGNDSTNQRLRWARQKKDLAIAQGESVFEELAHGYLSTMMQIAIFVNTFFLNLKDQIALFALVVCQSPTWLFELVRKQKGGRFPNDSEAISQLCGWMWIMMGDNAGLPDLRHEEVNGGWRGQNDAVGKAMGTFTRMR